MRPPSLPVLALALLSLAALAALVTGGAWAEWVFAAAVALFPAPLVALGAARRGRLPAAVGWTVAALSLTLAAAFAALLVLRGAPHQPGTWPVSLVVLLAGVWLLPLGFVGLAYALTFESHGVDATDLARLRRLRGDSHDDGGGER